MKRLLIPGIGLGLLLSASLVSHAAQTAQARIFCLSLRLQQGVYHGFDDVTLDLSTISLDTPNGELAPTFNNPDHFSGFRLYDTLFDEVVEEGEIDLDTPAFADANGNGFDDFFEVSQGVSGASAGAYSSAVDSGPVQATWSRAAGSKDGTYRFTIGTGQKSLGTYQGTFEILEYAGPLDYTPGASNVTGAVNLTQTGDPSSQLTGPIQFRKLPTNRFDELLLQHSVWTNASSQTIHIGNDIDSFLRDLTLKTNYYGFVDFDDGDPNTPDADFGSWVLSIDDSNDSNGNGIPDFSDDVSSTGARPPSLTLTPGGANLSLSISGTVGRTHEVQQITSLSQTNWATVSSVTLTNDPQSVSLSSPTNATSFWRVRVM